MPILTILAGPNGVGKTRTTDYLQELGLFSISPIDLDLLRQKAIDQATHSIYSIKPDKDLDKLFESYCKEAIAQNNDFCYECNLRQEQLKFIPLFEEAGYEKMLIYLMLDSIEQSRNRVDYRVKEENGRYVNDESIKENFIQGLINLDTCFDEFEYVLIIDNSLDFKDFKIIQMYVDKNNSENTVINQEFPNKEIRQYLPNIIRFKELYNNYEAI